MYQPLEKRDSYSKTQILEEARAAGYDPSERLFSDWVEKGLIDEGTRHGLGRGNGTSVTWPHEQLLLFIAVLQKRPEAKRIANLCNLPVWVWLWHGEDYVPKRQVRRALQTWAGRQGRSSSWRQARGNAQELVDRFINPDASQTAREQLINAIARASYGEPFNGTVILAAFRRAFDPHNEGRTLGPPGLVQFRPEHYIAIIEWRITALKAVQDHTIDDETLDWARSEYRISRREYAELVPKIAQHHELAKAFLKQTPTGITLPATLQETVDQACVDLLTLLGIRLQINSDTTNKN
jgi:hypothetical protein